MDRNDLAPPVHFMTVTDQQRRMAYDYALAGGSEAGLREVCGYFVRMCRFTDDRRLFVPGPFERGRRYSVVTTTDGLTFALRGWISGSSILRHGEIRKIDGRAGLIIEETRLRPLPKKPAAVRTRAVRHGRLGR